MLAARMVQKYLHQRHVADHDETQYEQTINKQQTNTVSEQQPSGDRRFINKHRPQKTAKYTGGLNLYSIVQCIYL